VSPLVPVQPADALQRAADLVGHCEWPIGTSAQTPEVAMDQLLSSQPLEESPTDHAHDLARARATVGRSRPPGIGAARLTLTPEQLYELTGYKRGAEQARWLKVNGFKFRLDRLGKPRVDRAHYEAKMGSKPAHAGYVDGGTPNWAALAGA